MYAEPLVSAIVPTFNHGDLVTDAVKSVIAQSYPNIEIIIVDDGSTDDTVARLSQFGSRIKLISQQHSGPAVARNEGVKAARGEFIAFLDSDDIWMPNKIERCVHALLNDQHYGIVYTAVLIHELDSGRKYPLPQYTESGNLARQLFLECKGVNTSTLVVRRSALDAAGLFDEEFFRAQDWDLMVRLAEKVNYLHVAEPLTERRLHARSLSVIHQELYAKYNLLVIQKAVARRPDLYADLQHEALSRAHYRFAMANYAQYKMKEARAEFCQSLHQSFHFNTFNYFVRTRIPVPVLRKLRQWRMSSGRGKNV